MRFIWDVPKPDYMIFWEKNNNVLLISRSDNPFEPGRPRWIAVTCDREMDFEPDERFEKRTYWRDAARKAMAATSPFTPGKLSFSTEGSGAREVVFAFGLGVTEEEAVEQARIILLDRTGLKKAKRDRLAALLGLHGFKRPRPPEEGESRMMDRSDRAFNDPRIWRAPPPGYGSREFKAYCWARASMDNLIMDQRGRGIYAGFHWFPNYWGRDSFICLPGACLSTGQYDTAREILTSFMEYQQTDPASPRLGRMPNIVNPDNLQYAGVDGTWWFVRAAWKYYLATGDKGFLIEAWPRIRLAIDGALEKAVDHKGFLTHGDGETWMDAGGEHNPYSPRGDRAVELQVLFHHGLLAGAMWAESVDKEGGDTGGKAEAWRSRAGMLAQSFRESYWYADRRYLHDHLNTDGSADTQIRPNALLALWVYLDTVRMLGLMDSFRMQEMPEQIELVTWTQFRDIVSTAIETVILPHGVTSLDPGDPDFKPLHLDLDNYYYDAAYHNGDVWVWLAGPAISCMVAAGEERAARELFAPMVTEILEEGCAGTLREIRDGRFIEGKEEFGGATSQAWSLAEFIRVSLEEFAEDTD
jgi:glycogen debranching enzyme